jgi:hypothetical protein
MKLHNFREEENKQEIKVQRREVKEGLTEHGSNPYSRNAQLADICISSSSSPS